MAVGRIYDTEELVRIQKWIDDQDKGFVGDERTFQKKEVLISSAIFVTISVMIIFTVYKLKNR